MVHSDYIPSIVSQKEWLALGTEGAALFVVVIALFAIIYVVLRHSHTINKTEERWSSVVDTIAKRHDESMKEITKNHNELQKETNLVIRDATEAIEGLKTQVTIYFSGYNEKNKSKDRHI